MNVLTTTTNTPIAIFDSQNPEKPSRAKVALYIIGLIFGFCFAFVGVILVLYGIYNKQIIDTIVGVIFLVGGLGLFKWGKKNFDDYNKLWK